MDISYWSVDHYYNSKVEHPENTYKKKTWTLALKGHYESLSRVRGEVDLEYDSPLEWERGTELRLYSYEQTQGRVKLELPVKDGWTGQLELWSERKKERVRQAVDQQEWAGARYYLDKELKRQTEGGEVAASSLPSPGRPGHYLGVWLVKRLADYSFNTFSAPDPMPEDAEEYSHDSDRKEWAVLALQARTSENFPDFLWGFQYNRITWDDDTSLRKGELKLQTAFDVLFREGIHLLINSTWDLDEIYRQRNRKFRPWGGGNLQIQATF